MRNRPLVWASVFVLVAVGLIAFYLMGRPRGQLADALQIGMGVLFVVLMAAKHQLDRKELALRSRQRDGGTEPDRASR